MAEEKVAPNTKDINRAIRSYAEANKKSVSIDRIKNNNHIAVGLDKPVKVTIERGPAGDFFGALNAGANIILNGSAGRFVGSTMSAGAVRVNGDVADGLGVYMSGGLVLIKGDCSGAVGNHMKGGVIIVDGDAKGEVGEGMVGGEIYITGNVEGTIGTDLKGGRIFVAGEMPELHDNVKVKPVGPKELSAIKDYHEQFRFRKFQTPEALSDFRVIEKA